MEPIDVAGVSAFNLPSRTPIDRPDTLQPDAPEDRLGERAAVAIPHSATHDQDAPVSQHGGSDIRKTDYIPLLRVAGRTFVPGEVGARVGHPEAAKPADRETGLLRLKEPKILDFPIARIQDRGLLGFAWRLQDRVLPSRMRRLVGRVRDRRGIGTAN